MTNEITTQWARQTLAVAKFELRRYVAARRWLGVYFLALFPVLLFLLMAILGWKLPPSQMDQIYAFVFQGYVLRFALFVSCGLVFSQLFRGETLEKTLHFYLLAPIRREVLTVGKYTAGCLATGALFGISTIATHALLYSGGGERMLFLAQYLAVVALACASYGAAFILIGLLAKNPSVPALLLLGWEWISTALPASLQKLSIVYYLKGLLPIQINRGAFAVVTEVPSAWLAVPALLIFSAAIVALAAVRARRLEVTYGTD